MSQSKIQQLTKMWGNWIADVSALPAIWERNVRYFVWPVDWYTEYLRDESTSAYIKAVDGSNDWKLWGNAVTSEQKIWTTTNFALPFVTNNIEAGRFTTGRQLLVWLTTEAGWYTWVVRAGTADVVTMGQNAGARIAMGTVWWVAAYMEFGAYNWVNQIDTKARDFRIYSTNATSAFSILQGNWWTGIGTNTPVTALQVQKSTAATNPPNTTWTLQSWWHIMRIGSLGNTATLDIGTTTTVSWLQSVNNTNLATNLELLLNPNGWNVGIGTISAPARLTISSWVSGFSWTRWINFNSTSTTVTPWGIALLGIDTIWFVRKVQWLQSRMVSIVTADTVVPNTPTAVTFNTDKLPSNWVISRSWSVFTTSEASMLEITVTAQVNRLATATQPFAMWIRLNGTTAVNNGTRLFNPNNNNVLDTVTFTEMLNVPAGTTFEIMIQSLDATAWVYQLEQTPWLGIGATERPASPALQVNIEWFYV